MNELKNRIVLVTGAGRGIGQAIARQLARGGAQLVLSARTTKQLRETRELCKGAESLVVEADLADPAEIDRLAREAISWKGRVDVLVNNAGEYGPIGPSHLVDRVEWEHAHRVNLFAPFQLTQRILHSMIREGRGKIIFLAGGGATAPMPNLSAYASSKAAVVRLAETFAGELRASNIQVNAVSPGLVDTKLQDKVLEAGTRAGPLFEKIRAARENKKGSVDPSIAAELVAFLASDASGELTGKLIAAPYDEWRTWAAKSGQLNESALYTLRRIDRHTVSPLLAELS